MSRRLEIILGIVALVLVVGAIAFFVVRSRSAGPVIDTATATRETLGVTVSASGQIGQGLHADVYPPAAGTLTAVYVKDGQTVKAGQKIAQLDTGPLQLQVDQARAALAQAEAQVDTINQQTPSGADIAAARANVTAAKSAYNASKIAYDNAVKAYNAAEAAFEASRAIGPAAVIQASTAKAQADAGVDQAYAAYKGAQAQLDKLLNTSTTDNRSAAEAAVDQAQEALSLAEATLADATLKAPFAGVVIFNSVASSLAGVSGPTAAVGAGVSPQSAPFTVVDLDASVFTAQVDEADIGRVKVGMAAKVTLDAYPGQEFTSKVVSIGKAAQATTTGGTIFPVDLEMTDVGVQLLLGMKGDASIEVSAVTEAVVIPVEALFNENGRNYVYLVENDKLKKQEIQVGATTETQVQVLSGVQAGQVVALSGATQYSDGMSVRTK